MSVHVFSTMGTMVSLRFPGDSLVTSDLLDIERVFRQYDRRFSLYDPQSPLSRIARGELALAAADEKIKDAYSLAIEWRNRTGGAFTPHRPDGVVDLSGVVKALAIADAGDVLDERAENWLLAVGGDILSRGVHDGSAWQVGIADPARRDRLAGMATLSGTRRAVATSGTAERGDHIWGRNASGFVQVTVAADDIVTADVLATAIVAGDADDLDGVTAQFDVDVLTLAADGVCRATPGARSWLS